MSTPTESKERDLGKLLFDCLDADYVTEKFEDLSEATQAEYQAAAARFALTLNPVEKRCDGVGLIAAERERQVSQEKWTAEHDDTYTRNELALAAAAYAMPLGYVGRNHEWQPFHALDVWPFDVSWYKRDSDNRIKDLVRAGALIAAEIDRLQRCGSKISEGKV